MSSEVQMLQQLLPTAEFIAIDLEFTGLNPYQDTMPRYFDPIELRFQQAKDVADAFTVIQLGLCFFNRARDGILSAHPMSFLIRPSTGIFSCQTTSIRFLVDDGQFDFNELFRNGLPSDGSGREIMKQISESKVPLVMHNGLLDLMFITKTFFEPIADNLDSFKQQCRRLFPTVFDSKLVCSKSQYLRGTFGSFWLEKVFEHVSTDDQFMDLPPIRMTPGFEEKQHHDAAFDAYMAGVVFARARHCIQYSSPKSIIQTDNWLVETIDWSTSDIMQFANRICLNRCIQHLDLTSNDAPSFRGVLKVAIQESSSVRVRTSHIVDVLKPVIRQDRVKLLWDDDRTAFAILGAQFHDRLQWIATTVNNSTRLAGFTVEPYYGI